MPFVHHRVPKIHFEDHAPPAGALGAPIVLCHGLLCTSAVWDGVIGPLRARRRSGPRPEERGPTS
jgi:pimeloyl-ACP methyl ester carboxylesterase